PYNLSGFEKGRDIRCRFYCKQQPCRRVEHTSAAPLFPVSDPTIPSYFLKKAPVSGAFFCA
ncbi:MAG: hypothetical protein ACRDDF_02225, partial [Aeromonas sp.]